MSTGEALAAARRGAGLTVSQVSGRTRIREAIITGIERDDYAACGGDFYARGHIRAIARAVGADPEPLVREYDTIRQAAPPIPAAVLRPPVRDARARPPVRDARARPPVRDARARPPVRDARARPPVRDARARPPVPDARARPPVPADPARPPLPADVTGPAVPGGGPGRQLNRPAVLMLVLVALGLALLAGLILLALQLLAGPRPAASDSARSHPAARHQAGHRTPPPSPPPSPSPSPKTTTRRAVRVRALTPASARAFGPYGGGRGDNPQRARLAIDRSAVTAWHTDWYTTARLGNLYPGTGLLVNMGRPVTITAARIRLGSAHGARFQLRVGARPTLADLRPVAGAASAGGLVRLRLARPARGRYVVIWFTRLPPDRAGTFQASVHDLRLTGRR